MMPLCNWTLKPPHGSSSNWDKWWQGHEWLRASHVAGWLGCVQDDITTASVLISAQPRHGNPADHKAPCGPARPLSLRPHSEQLRGGFDCSVQSQLSYCSARTAGSHWATAAASPFIFGCTFIFNRERALSLIHKEEASMQEPQGSQVKGKLHNSQDKNMQACLIFVITEYKEIKFN